MDERIKTALVMCALLGRRTGLAVVQSPQWGITLRSKCESVALWQTRGGRQANFEAPESRPERFGYGSVPVGAPCYSAVALALDCSRLRDRTTPAPTVDKPG
jgi:hypothetical protein